LEPMVYGKAAWRLLRQRAGKSGGDVKGRGASGGASNGQPVRTWERASMGR
jgi:hypothetical protein